MPFYDAAGKPFGRRLLKSDGRFIPPAVFTRLIVSVSLVRPGISILAAAS